MRYAVIFGIIFNVLSVSTTALAEKKTSYAIGVERIMYLPQWAHDNQKYIGFARDFFDFFATENNIGFQYKVLPIKRLFYEFLSEKSTLDFKFPDHPNWKSEMKKGANIVYSDPILHYIDGVVVLPKNKGKGLKNLKVLGTAMGFTPWDYLGHIKSKKIRLHENRSFTGLLEQVINGRIDGAYINITVSDYHLREIMKRPGALVFDPGLPHTKDSYHLSTKTQPQLIKKVNTFLKQKKKEIEVLKGKFGISDRIGEAR